MLERGSKLENRIFRLSNELPRVFEEEMSQANNVS